MKRPTDVRRLDDVAFHTSAFGVAEEEADPVEHAVLGDSVAFVHDLTSGPLPEEYQSCDIIYSETPWPTTLKGFNERAGIDVQWADLKAAIWQMIEQRPCPVVLLAGPVVRRSLPATFDQAIDTSMFGGTPETGGSNCSALVYGAELPVEEDLPSHFELIRWLAGRFDRVGDPACGYGLAGRIFREQGKSFVLSDYNARCIGYIADRAEEWVPDGS